MSNFRFQSCYQLIIVMLYISNNRLFSMGFCLFFPVYGIIYHIIVFLRRAVGSAGNGFLLLRFEFLFHIHAQV